MTTRKLTILFFFPTVIVINIISFIVISLFHQETQAGFYFTLWYQVAGLFDYAHSVGIDVIGRHTEFLPSPNMLGWLLIVVNCSIVLSIYYAIAIKIATIWKGRVNKDTHV